MHHGALPSRRAPTGSIAVHESIHEPLAVTSL